MSLQKAQDKAKTATDPVVGGMLAAKTKTTEDSAIRPFKVSIPEKRSLK
jgi:hypothetical protein